MKLFCKNKSHNSDALPFLKNFTNKEIERATDGYSQILGRDHHGTVYKAQFSDGLIATVKKRSHLQHEIDTFSEEIKLLGRLHHRNLVGLKGFSEGYVRFLVFDHMEIGSLKDCLHDPFRTPLTWRIRLQIAIDIAAALEYLFYFCDPPVHNVSMDSKNVLLDKNFVAKISELSFRHTDCDCDNANDSDITSSQDYIDRKRKDAVYQFGRLILELVTGQSLGEEDELVQWVQESEFACSMHNMVDADLGNDYDSKELKCLLIIARLCTRNANEPVIYIPQILRYLQGKVEPPLLYHH